MKTVLHYDQLAVVQHRVFCDLLDFTDIDRNVRNIVDLGCGSGVNTVTWAERFPNASVCGIDASEPFIEYAQAHNPHPRVTYACFDLHRWEPPLEPVIDLVVSNACLHWINPLDSFIGRIVPFLSPTGNFSISMFGPKTYSELHHVLETDIESYQHISAQHFLDGQMLQHIFERYFERVSIQTSIITKVYPTLLSLLKVIQSTGTWGSGIGRKGLWTPGLMRQLESTYQKLYGQIHASHQIFYLQAENPI